MAAEAVKVIVRCRPLNEREKNLNCKTVVTMDSGKGHCTIQKPDSSDPPKNFTFDGAYFTASTTEQIYNDIAFPLVEGVLEGYNGTVFAYGQTGCGKSFSMQGIPQPVTQRGIIPRAFEHIFEDISVAENIKYLVHSSYLEIYNEEIRDLLGKDIKSKLELREHPDRGVYIQGLSMHAVHNVVDCERVMEQGWNNRSVGATLMNADSSRSHSIFTIHLEMIETDESGEDHIRAGKLNLVDLAGSERQAKTGATGDRLKEATKINLSLSALGNVISALVDGKSKHIPYRDSKLTRLLQDSLGGNTKTLMVACLSPADNNYDETLSTLRYANRAKNIKNKPKINEDPKDALLRQYQEEINQLKAMLMGQIPMPEGGFPASLQQAIQLMPTQQKPAAHSAKSVEEERDHIKKEYEEKLEEMQAKYEQEQESKAKLQEDIAKLRRFYDSKLDSVNEKYENELKEEYGKMSITDGEGEEQKPGTAQPTVVQTEDKDQQQQQQQTQEQPPGPEIFGVLGIISADSHIAIEGEGGQPYQPMSEESGPPGEEGEEGGGGPSAPRSSPKSGERTTSANVVQHEEALKRLQELQTKMVGGEQAKNEELKEKRRKKLKHAEMRKLKLAKAIANMDDDGIMLNIYNNIEEELHAKNKLLDEEKRRLKAAQVEITDLQSEFEFERIDYLATIRQQEKQLQLAEQLLHKVQPIIRRDCNYYNLDKIRTDSRFDEEENQWILPELATSKTSLPSTTGGQDHCAHHHGQAPPPPLLASHSGSLGGKTPSNKSLAAKDSNSNLMNGGAYVGASYPEALEEDRFYHKLNKSSNEKASSDYFKPKRAHQILEKNKNIGDKDHQLSPVSSHSSLLFNGDQKSLQAAQVHGQIGPTDVPRRPQRLEALPSGPKTKKKKSKTTVPPL